MYESLNQSVVPEHVDAMNHVAELIGRVAQTADKGPMVRSRQDDVQSKIK